MISSIIGAHLKLIEVMNASGIVVEQCRYACRVSARLYRVNTQQQICITLGLDGSFQQNKILPQKVKKMLHRCL